MSIGLVENFVRFPAVQKFWKSVRIWQRYRQFKGGNFFETQRISSKYSWLVQYYFTHMQNSVQMSV